jgi:hypothetical protein
MGYFLSLIAFVVVGSAAASAAMGGFLLAIRSREAKKAS